MTIKAKLSRWLNPIPRSQTLWLGTVAVLVGVTTGIGVWLFKGLIQWVQFGMGRGATLFGTGAVHWTVILIPVVAGIVVALISRYFIGEQRLHGVAGIMESVALAGGRLRYKGVPLKAVVSAISIGAGAPLGPEDPSVQIGANLGSMFAQSLHMSDERVRLLVAAGAAAAIAAAFNAPIAGVFFALELILGEINASSLGMMLVASVASSAFTQAISGPEPAFHIPTYAIRSVWELPLYLGLGLLAGPVSALYVRTLYAVQDTMRRIQVNALVKAIATGLIIGMCGLFLPQLLGTGYDTIQEILNRSDLALWLLLALLLVRLILTPLSLAGGFSGGVFAPSLYLGAVLGSAFGLATAHILPGLNINPSAFALVGMAAVLAGAVRAPLTATILLFEMTNDYRIILPVMLAVAVSVLLSERFQRDSIYLTALVRLGIRLDRGRDVEVLRTITVGEAMQTNVETLPEAMPLLQAAEVLAKTRHHGLPVVNSRGNLIGMITVRDIDAVEEDQRDSTTVGAACTRELLVAFPNDSLSDALLRMSHGDVGRLPVVDRNYPTRLIGVLRRADVIRSYEIALVRRASQRHRAEEIHLDAMTPERVLVANVAVADGAMCDGKQMKAIHWPEGSLIASVRRRNKVFIPHGDTTIKAGDILVVVAEAEVRDQVAALCRAPAKG